MAVKLVAYGCGGYWRDGWNVLDFVIVLGALMNLFMRGSGTDLSAMKAIRALRALRPLRMISRNPGMAALKDDVPKVLRRGPCRHSGG